MTAIEPTVPPLTVAVAFAVLTVATIDVIVCPESPGPMLMPVSGIVCGPAFSGSVKLVGLVGLLGFVIGFSVGAWLTGVTTTVKVWVTALTLARRCWWGRCPSR